MTRRLTEQTICGVRLDAFAEQPSPAELGAIVARMDSEDQAAFLIAMGAQLQFTCGPGKYAYQLCMVRDALAAQEERLCTGYGSQLVEELQPTPATQA